MKNWVVKLLLLLFIPSFVGILFTVILGFNPGGWLQITTYALPPLLTLAGGAFIVASRWKIPFLILMAAASMAFMGHRTKRILRIERKEYQTY